MFLLILALPACSPVSSALQEVAEPNADTTNAGSADDTAGQADATDPDYSRWAGSQRFSYDYSDRGYYCDETVSETGTALTEEDPRLPSLKRTCPECTAFYAVTPDRSTVCDWIPVPASWRGVTLTQPNAAVHIFEEGREDGWTEAEWDNAASFDGMTLHYSFEVGTDSQEWSVEVAGTAVFEAGEE